MKKIKIPFILIIAMLLVGFSVCGVVADVAQRAGPETSLTITVVHTAGSSTRAVVDHFSSTAMADQRSGPETSFITMSSETAGVLVDQAMAVNIPSGVCPMVTGTMINVFNAKTVNGVEVLLCEIVITETYLYSIANVSPTTFALVDTRTVALRQGGGVMKFPSSTAVVRHDDSRHETGRPSGGHLKFPHSMSAEVYNTTYRIQSADHLRI